VRDQQDLGRSPDRPRSRLRPLHHSPDRRRRTRDPRSPARSRRHPISSLTNPNNLPGNAPEKLLAHLDGRTGLAGSGVEVGGKTYRIVHPETPDALIDEAEFDRDERLPYWAELWPSALALARRLAGLDLSDRQAIELGCGVGLPSLVALDRGARVLATDHYAAALDFAAHNARVNLGREPDTRLLDWFAPDLAGIGAAFDLTLAADVLYEERNARALAALVPVLLVPKGQLLLADPGRRWEPLFRDLMHDEGFVVETQEATVDPEGRRITVLLHRFWRG
jgi:predicted nicotinamide N-methyase